jgi:hypothetical protein
MTPFILVNHKLLIFNQCVITKIGYINILNIQGDIGMIFKNGMSFKNGMIALAIASLLTGCGGGGGEEADAGKTAPDTTTPDTTTPDTTTPDTKKIVTFLLTGAVSVVTTDNTAIQTTVGTNSVRTTKNSIIKSDNSKLNSFTFIDADNAEDFKKKKRAALLPLGPVARSSSATAREGEVDGTASNLFVIDENGAMKFAAESEYDFKVSYSVVKDLENAEGETEQFIYFALDSNDLWASQQFIAATDNCAIFKVASADGTWSCVANGVTAISMDESYRKTLSDEKRKPLQVDVQGNVYFLGREYITQDNDGDGVADWIDNNWEVQPTIHKVTLDGTVAKITGDDIYVNSFIQISDNSIVYSYSGTEQGLRMVTTKEDGNISTVELGDSSGYWHDFFYAIDDSNTVIYFQGGGSNNGINFSQPHPEQEGWAKNYALDTSAFSSNGWDNTPRRVMMADDGSIYGLFSEYGTNSKGDDGEFASLKRMLPYSKATYARFFVDNWWNYFDNGNRNVQISKGYVFYIEDEVHSQAGDRSVIHVVRMADGEKTSILGDAEWAERYDISNWKLSNDTLFFTGFDYSTSAMITGEIDVLAIKDGKDESEYLTLSQAASIVGESNTIEDYEVLVARAPDGYTGGNPSIVRTFSDSENIYSVSIEFNKWMDTDSVNANTSVSYNMTPNDELSTATNVETLNVWLGRRLHMIFDTNTASDSFTTDPLPYGSQVNITVDTKARDLDGIELISGLESTASEVVSEFVLRPESGFYGSADEVVGDITDGQVLNYAFAGDNYWQRSAKAELAKEIKTLNHRIEFSTPAKLKGGIQFQVSEGYQVDSSGSGATDGTNTYENVDGYYVDADFNIYEETHLDVYDELWRTWERTLTVTATEFDDVEGTRYRAATSKTYTLRPGHQIDLSGNIYVQYQDETLGLEVLKDVTDTSNTITYKQREGHYVLNSDPSVKYYHSFGNYRDDNNNIIDDYSTVTWVDYAWVTLDSEEVFEVALEWVNETWVDEADNSITLTVPANRKWQSNYYTTDLDANGEIDLAGLAVFNHDTDTNVDGETVSEWKDGWDWTSVFTADSFVRAEREFDHDHDFFVQTRFGGWHNERNDSIRTRTLVDSNPDWFHNEEHLVGELDATVTWVKHTIEVTTDSEGVVNFLYTIADAEGNVIKEDERILFMDVKQASWQFLKDIPEKGGFDFDLFIEHGSISIDNVKVTDLTDLDNAENGGVIFSSEFTKGNEGVFIEAQTNN